MAWVLNLSFVSRIVSRILPSLPIQLCVAIEATAICV